uniref:Uncharacterized protein n=1 Tax=Arundo donax TaxID=35708 RepID=A0A0A9CNT0_ARUDO
MQFDHREVASTHRPQLQPPTLIRIVLYLRKDLHERSIQAYNSFPTTPATCRWAKAAKSRKRKRQSLSLKSNTSTYYPTVLYYYQYPPIRQGQQQLEAHRMTYLDRFTS